MPDKKVCVRQTHCVQGLSRVRMCVHSVDLVFNCFPHAAEIIMVDNYVMVYKYLGDLMFYVTGSQDENELVLYAVLQAFYESISMLLRCECVLNHVSNLIFCVHSCPCSSSALVYACKFLEGFALNAVLCVLAVFISCVMLQISCCKGLALSRD
jgi:hypothetical protein